MTPSLGCVVKVIRCDSLITNIVLAQAGIRDSLPTRTLLYAWDFWIPAPYRGTGQAFRRNDENRRRNTSVLNLTTLFRRRWRKLRS